MSENIAVLAQAMKKNHTIETVDIQECEDDDTLTKSSIKLIQNCANDNKENNNPSAASTSFLM